MKALPLLQSVLYNPPDLFSLSTCKSYISCLNQTQQSPEGYKNKLMQGKAQHRGFAALLAWKIEVRDLVKQPILTEPINNELFHL